MYKILERMFPIQLKACLLVHISYFSYKVWGITIKVCYSIIREARERYEKERK
jgi:hypothetical protein